MQQALRAFSRKGQFKELVSARDIRSREHARKLWPLVDPESPNSLVTYHRPSFYKKSGTFKSPSHFAKLPIGKGKSVIEKLTKERDNWHKWRSESAEHLKAKNLLTAELSRRLQIGSPLLWAFLDPSCDFPLKGDILLGASTVASEYPFQAPFDNNFRLDIAVLGPEIDGTRLILAGIEIELTHAFEGFKGLISKTVGFPMISVDITDMTIEDIDEEWAANIIQSTTLTADGARRKNYFYLHDLLYPQFLSFPSHYKVPAKHQYLVFAPGADLVRLDRYLRTQAEKMGVTGVVSQKVGNQNLQIAKDLEGLGNVVGPDWKEINPDLCLRISLNRPTGIDDLLAHQFHIFLARTLLAERDALIGYKYQPGIYNNNDAEDVWVDSVWQGPGKDPVSYRILPKRLVEPLNKILKLIESLQANGVAEAD